MSAFNNFSIPRRPLSLSTADLPPARQFEALCDAYRGVFDFQEGARHLPGASIKQDIWPLGRLLLVSVFLPPGSAGLRWRHCKKAESDPWYVLLPRPLPDGRSGRGTGAKASFHRLGQPADIYVEAPGALMLFGAREALADGSVSALTSEAAEAGTALLADFLLALERQLPNLPPAGNEAVTEVLHCLLSVCAVSEASSDVLPPMETALLERACRFIRGRLTHSNLAPDMICRELGVSRSRLYRLFEEFGGISTYMRRQRLLGARQALLDRADMRAIASIAAYWGFQDASVFSRAFRKEFGQSPKSVREARFDASPPVPADVRPRLSVAALLREMMG